MMTLPSSSWPCSGMKMPTVFSSAERTCGASTILRKVGRADLLLAFGDEHQVDGELLAGAADGMQRGKEGGLRTLLVGGAAAHQDGAETGLLDELRVPGRRAPLGGVDLLDVVHEVEAERVLRAGVERREHAGVAFGRDDLGVLEAGVEGELLHHLGALGHADVLGGDRGLLDPGLQARDGFVVATLDLVVDGAELALGVGSRRLGGGPECRTACGGVRDEIPTRNLGHLVHSLIQAPA